MTVENGTKQADESVLEATTNTVQIPKLEQALFVVGHPRSGTSLTCQIAETDPDHEFLVSTGSNARNPGGYYEYQPLLQLSLTWLSSDKSEWHPQKMSKVLNTMRHLEGIPSAKLLQVPAWWYWREVLQDCTILLPYRNPADMTVSCWRQRLLNLQFDWREQANHQIGIFEREDNAVLIRHERLVNNPGQVQELLDDELDLEVSVDMVSTDNHSIDSSDVVVGDLAETIYERLNELEESQYE